MSAMLALSSLTEGTKPVVMARLHEQDEPGVMDIPDGTYKHLKLPCFPNGTAVRLKCGSGPAVMVVVYQPQEDKRSRFDAFVGVMPYRGVLGYGCQFYNDSGELCRREYPADLLEEVTP